LTIYALQIISESVARTAFPVAVALGIASGQTAVALGIVAAPTLSLIVVPFAFLHRFRNEVPEPRPLPEQQGEASDQFSLARGGRFAAGVFLIMLSEQTFLNAGVLTTKATAGAAAAGYVFNILMIARAPLQLFQAVQTSLLPHLTTLGSRGEEKDFRASIRVTLLAVASFAALVALALLIAGPQLMHIAFGNKHDYARSDLVVVAVGMGLYLSAATLNQAALARGQVRRASFCWVGTAIAFIVWIVVPIVSDDVTRVVVGYLGAATLLCSLLYWLYRQPLEPREMRVEPGSTEEMELQLASADEAG
jgi:O-antigen/teichoic acid export membrane protein